MYLAVMIANLVDMIHVSQTLLIKADINMVLFCHLLFATMNHDVLRFLSL